MGILSKRKITMGVFLIIISFLTIFISVLPSIYSNNNAGKVVKVVDVNFDFLKKEKTPYALLYFGYVGCYTVCPPALNEISQIYKSLDKKKKIFFFFFFTQTKKPQKKKKKKKKK